MGFLSNYFRFNLAYSVCIGLILFQLLFKHLLSFLFELLQVYGLMKALLLGFNFLLLKFAPFFTDISVDGANSAKFVEKKMRFRSGFEGLWAHELSH